MAGERVQMRGNAISRRNLLTSCTMLSALSLVAVNVGRDIPKPAAMPAVPTIQAAATAMNTVAAVVATSTEPTPVVPASLIGSGTLTAASDPARDNSPLAFSITLLEEANRRLSTIRDYTASFIKQERIDSEFGELNHIRLKIRHEPFSVYMSWIEPDAGREVVYVEGRNENQLLAHQGGFAGLLIPMLRLDPNGSLAMRDNRHPITELGVGYLAARLLEDRRREVGDPNVQVTMEETADVEGRACWKFEVVRAVPDGTEYGKAVFYIDKEMGIPLRCDTFDWPVSPGAEPLQLEHYRYEEVRLNVGMSDQDFDPANPEYGFKRL